jgi:hypothetical protein
MGSSRGIRVARAGAGRVESVSKGLPEYCWRRPRGHSARRRSTGCTARPAGTTGGRGAEHSDRITACVNGRADRDVYPVAAPDRGHPGRAVVARGPGRLDRGCCRPLAAGRHGDAERRAGITADGGRDVERRERGVAAEHGKDARVPVAARPGAGDAGQAASSGREADRDQRRPRCPACPWTHGYSLLMRERFLYTGSRARGVTLASLGVLAARKSGNLKPSRQCPVWATTTDLRLSASSSLENDPEPACRTAARRPGPFRRHCGTFR